MLVRKPGSHVCFQASEVNQCMGVFFVEWCWRSASCKGYFAWDRISENFHSSYVAISHSENLWGQLNCSTQDRNPKNEDEQRYAIRQLFCHLERLLNHFSNINPSMYVHYLSFCIICNVL